MCKGLRLADSRTGYGRTCSGLRSYVSAAAERGPKEHLESALRRCMLHDDVIDVYNDWMIEYSASEWCPYQTEIISSVLLHSTTLGCALTFEGSKLSTCNPSRVVARDRATYA